MSYNNVPLTGQSLDQTRVPINSNFSIIRSRFADNHVDFDDGSGKHKFMQMPEQASAPTTAANEGALYTKDASGATQLFWRAESNGAEMQMTPVVPFRAAVNFQGRASNGACTINYQFNVASVTRTGTGLYTIAFSTPLPSNNYVPSGMGMRASGQGTGITIQSDATYGNKVKVNELLIAVDSLDSGNPLDPVAAMVQIVGG